MNHYCTLFDHNYLPRGIVLHDSLMEHSSGGALLHVLCMSSQAEATILKLKRRSDKFDNLFVYNLDYPGFDRNALIKARGNRTWTEFCWTMASVFSNMLLKSGIREITYLDADMMFFGDPAVVHKEIRISGIGIIPHRFIPEKKHLEINGKFNVSWVTLKDTPRSMACSNEWAAQCLEWCYYRVEGNKFGDQKYLDEWPSKYHCECKVIENIGAGLAPWNLANYNLGTRDGVLYAEQERVIFYHYHEFAELDNGKYRLTNYKLREEDVRYIYNPFILEYEKAKALVIRLKED